MAVEEDSVGICEGCLHDAEKGDTLEVVSLYKLGGNLLCGDCANCYAGDVEFHERAYGSDGGDN